MRVLLINVPVREEDIPRNFPTGLGIIAQVLRQKGHEVSVLDINAQRFSREMACGVIAALPDPDVIGVSGLISTYKYQKWFFPQLKRLKPRAILVAGGGCATAVPELLLEKTPCDYVVMGEGETTFAELLDAMAAGRDCQGISGTGCLVDGHAVFGPTRGNVADLDSLPLPAYDLFPTEIYLSNPIWFRGGEHGASMNMISSRGCPMDCGFCYHLFGRRSYRQRSAAHVIAEVRLLKERYGVKFIAFVDDNMMVNPAFLSEFCGLMGPLGIEWGCHGRVDCVSRERLRMMRKSGCVWLGFGIESGSQRILDRMNKRVTVEQARAAVQLTREEGICPNCTFIFGYPGEDMESIRETMRFQLGLCLAKSFFLATPYPGTPLYAEARSKGLIKDEEEFILSLNDAADFTVNLTGFSDRQLLGLRRRVTDELALIRRLQVDYLCAPGKEGFLRQAKSMLNRRFLIPEIRERVLMMLADLMEKAGEHDGAAACRMKMRSAVKGGGDREFADTCAQ